VEEWSGKKENRRRLTGCRGLVQLLKGEKLKLTKKQPPGFGGSGDLFYL
jgi:hypothetical protein